MFTKENLKRTFGVIKKVFFVIFIVIFVIFGILILIPEKYYQKFNEWFEEKAAQKIVEELERPYKEDTYGGKTPEETFQLFIDALKKGDVELASKYFDIKKQDAEKDYLNKVKTAGKLNEMITDFSRGLIYTGSLYEGNKQYEIKDESGKVIFGLVDFTQYPSGVWKITEL